MERRWLWMDRTCPFTLRFARMCFLFCFVLQLVAFPTKLLPSKLLQLDVRKMLFSERVVRYWHRLPKEVLELLSLEFFKGCGYMTLGDKVQ